MAPPLPIPRVALVTGAGRRIGRAIALELASQGWKVGVHYAGSAADAEEVADQIRAIDGTAVALKADLASAEEVARLVPACVAALGAPGCLVNNAALFLDDRIGALEPATWDQQMAVNLRAPVFLAEAMAAALPAGKGGAVINIIDQRVWHPVPEFFSYGVAKAGLWAATRMLAQALAPRVRVNAIGPGPVLRSVHQSGEEFAAEAAGTLLKRTVSPDEIAAGVRFILDAPSMTGQMIALDAGQHLA